MRFATVAAAGAFAALGAIAPAGGGERPRPARAGNLEVGDPAPDFELVLLESPSDAKARDAKKDGARKGDVDEAATPAGAPSGEKPDAGAGGTQDSPAAASKAPGKLRLSSLRGKSAVVLVFSSYT